jgi:hypothetical protein
MVKKLKRCVILRVSVDKEEEMQVKKVLSLNLEGSQADAVAAICGHMNIQHEILDESLKDDTIENILSKKIRIKADENTEDDKPLSSSLLIFCQLTDKEIDRFLEEYKSSGAQALTLKSALTETNSKWTLGKLYGELMREHIFYKMHERR